MTTDAVESVILEFLDHLDGHGPQPNLDGLTPADRRLATEVIRGLVTARGIDPRATPPSADELLAGTPLAALLAPAGHPGPADHSGLADLATVAAVVAAADPGAQVTLDRSRSRLVFAYLDLQVRVLLAEAATPDLTPTVRAAVDEVFARDPDISRVAVVAARSQGLVTDVIAPDQVGDTVVMDRAAGAAGREPPLPLALAVSRLREQAVPQWPAYHLGHGLDEPLDPGDLAADLAQRVLDREAARPYRGDKRLAYRSLSGRADDFADLAAQVSRPGARVDLAAAIDRIWQAAA